MRESQPKAVMTSYNLLNGTHTAEHHGLIMDILRAEFGYEGIVMTDWVTPMTGDARSAHRDSQAQDVAAAGGDLFMPGNKGDYDHLLQGIDSGAVTLEQVKIGASRVLLFIFNGIAGLRRSHFLSHLLFSAKFSLSLFMVKTFFGFWCKIKASQKRRRRAWIW